MEKMAARRLGIALLSENDLFSDGWRVDFHQEKNHFGSCNYRRKTIYLSEPLLKAMNEDNVRNCVLHEIAHALTPGHEHDSVWRNKFIALGGDGKTENGLSGFNSLEEMAVVI